MIIRLPSMLVAVVENVLHQVQGFLEHRAASCSDLTCRRQNVDPHERLSR